MRDLEPADAEHQSELLGSVLRELHLSGYEQVALPAFEYLDVLARGLGQLGPDLLFRFVEPETGEIVALRPDMTPQVARFVCSRWQGRPRPLRLCYWGSILRRRPERARHDEQVLQAGFELVGCAGVEADFEVIDTSVRALRVAGLTDFVLDVGHGEIAPALLAQAIGAGHPAQAAILEALSHKDSSELARLLQDTRAPKPLVDALCELPGLHGSKEVFARARALPGFQSAARALGSLEELVLRLEREGLSDRIVVDLGETLTAPYYTGMMFQVLADGPGQALLSGGRYDELFGRFGRGMAAAGAAIHIDHLRWALASRGRQRPPRVMVSAATHPGESSLEAEVRSVLEALRAAGVPASRDLEPWLHADLRAFARESGFGYVASVQKGGAVEMLDASNGTLTPCSLNEFLESVGKN